MKKLLTFSADQGGEVTFEVVALEQEGFSRSGRPSQVAELAEKSLETALSGVKPAAESILNQLLNLSKRPTEVEVEFGLKVSGDFGVIIASGAVEANYVVKLKWAMKDAAGGRAS